MKKKWMRNFKKVMSQQINAELLALKKTLIEGMVNFMKYGGAEDENDESYDPDFDAGYTQTNVDECDKILTDFLNNLVTAPANGRNDFITTSVKSVVLKLNNLNSECDGGLIETDQREQICALIFSAVEQAGLATKGVDITEEWREW